MGSEVDQSKEWAKRHLQLRSKGSRHAAACVTASAELPLSPREAYELMSHPDNAVIFRGIERCTYRQVLWAAADAGRPSDGRQTVEVENESGGPLTGTSPCHAVRFLHNLLLLMMMMMPPGSCNCCHHDCQAWSPPHPTCPSLCWPTAPCRFHPGQQPGQLGAGGAPARPAPLLPQWLPRRSGPAGKRMPSLLLLPAVCAISRACCCPNVKQQQQFACMHWTNTCCCRAAAPHPAPPLPPACRCARRLRTSMPRRCA